MQFVKNIFIASILLITSSAYANNYDANDYDANYYDDEGALLFKVRGFYLNSSSKIKAKPVNAVEAPGSLIDHGYGFDTATTFFFTDNIATEISLGLALLKTKKSTLNKASAAYGSGTGSAGKNNDIFFIPLAATIQYHIAPFGGIRPYLGGGYHGAYSYTRSKAISVSTAHGGVLQAGIDFVAKDDTLITFDVRKYFVKPKVTFKQALLSNTPPSDLSSKIDLSPLIISVGVGFKF